MAIDILTKGKKIITGPQSSVLSAASIIMVMIIVSRLLGLVRQRVLGHFFGPEDISIFFAAFRLPDSIFEVLVFGTFSSAFIPVFTKALKEDGDAWNLASRVSNVGLTLYFILFAFVFFFADTYYGFIAPGYSAAAREEIVTLTKILFAAQGFFLLSYVLTGVLESFRRFLIPALAPLFYNVGIIVGIFVFQKDFGLLAPALGVLLGALVHFLVQLPLAIKLGYKVTTSFKIDKNVKKIGRLAAPRMVEVLFNQLAKSSELYLSSLISTASYAYYTLGNTIQLIPVGIIGTSVAKAALPTLSEKSDDIPQFRQSLWNALNLVIFFIMPISAFLIVLRIPIVRLLYGTEIFDWASTIQTGYVVSAFAISVIFQAAISLLSRGFYALHDTKTPVKISLCAILLNIFLNFLFIREFNFSVWGLALAFSFSSALQFSILFFLMLKRTESRIITIALPFFKSLSASFVSALGMYFILKVFDRSAWIKRLSFLGKLDETYNLPFEKFVLDTRYTINLLILTIIVLILGSLIYLFLSFVFRSQELFIFINVFKRLFKQRKEYMIPEKESEIITPSAKENLQ